MDCTKKNSVNKTQLMLPMFAFEEIYRSKISGARVGKITTPHGVIDTPNFVPVGTNAAIKGIDAAMIDDIGIHLIFCNTYHLMIQPGESTVAAMGGIHKFMGRKFPIITDSGGFQVFSLAYGGVAEEIKSKGKKRGTSAVEKIDDDGVTFRSYKDGRKIVLTPESSIRAQKLLGADIIVAFDELPPYHMDHESLKKSLARTHRWEERSLQEHEKSPQQQGIYGIIHGGVDDSMRQDSYRFLERLNFDGFAIGGSVGKDREEMVAMLSTLLPSMERERPRHLLGIGDMESLARCIPLGIDTFDSSHPTKCARHGIAFTSAGNVNVTKGQYADEKSPIDNSCGCPTCQKHSIAYIHHLFKAHELSAMTLTSVHNIFFMNYLMKNYRNLIVEGKL